MAKPTGKGSGKSAPAISLRSPTPETYPIPNEPGRPSEYKQELADKICEQLSIGYSLRTIIKDPELPSIATIFKWMRTNEEFLNQYARAKQEAADAMAEDILDISDNATNDWMEDNYDKGKTPGYALNGENIQRSKLRVDTRKFLMAKMKPKIYGDKLDMTTNGKDLPTPIMRLDDAVHRNDRNTED